MAAEVRSPFLDAVSFTHDPSPPRAPVQPIRSATPFLSAYEVEEEAARASGAPESQLLASELYNEELDEAIFEVVSEASDLYRQNGSERWDRERLLRQHFAPLERELNEMFDAASDRFEQGELPNLDAQEVEGFFDGYRPKQELQPAFENLFGGILSAIKKAASTAVNAAKTGISALGSLALGPLLGKLKALVKPLLERVLKRAINYLPESLRGPATLLAQRFGLAEAEESEGEEEGSPGGGLAELQLEFNRNIADAVYAPGEVERDLEVARAMKDAEAPTDEALAELDRAREALADQLSRLKEGEDAAPAFENFIPALLPVLRLGIRLAGRKTVMSFLAGLVANLLRRFIGPQYAPALSKAIVDAGFHLLSLEAAPSDPGRAATAAITATVEDTVRRVSELPEYMLEDQELLEGAALQAFEQAAAANLPPVLGQETYRMRPDLRESALLRGTWIGMPHCHRPRYKKYTQVLRARLTPEKARAIETFGGATLAEFLEEQMGQAPGSDFEANVQLYESVPGTMLPEVARLEKATPGLGSSAQVSYGQLHPLTQRAAATLLGEPGLGRRMSPDSLSAPYQIRPGQRFYHLSIPGVRPPMASSGPGRLRRSTSLSVRLDFPAREIRVRLHLSETAAQKLFVRLREQVHVGTIVAWLKPELARKLDLALTPHVYRRVHVIHHRVKPWHSLGYALRHLPPVLSLRVRRILLHWMVEGLADVFKNQTQQLLKAIESPKDGVTFTLVFQNPPLLEVLNRVFEGKGIPLDAAVISGALPKTEVAFTAGYAHG